MKKLTAILLILLTSQVLWGQIEANEEITVNEETTITNEEVVEEEIATPVNEEIVADEIVTDEDSIIDEEIFMNDEAVISEDTIVVKELTVNEKKAQKKIEKAAQLMEKGKIEEALLQLNEAQTLTPENIYIAYEIASIYYLKGDYVRVTKILEEVKSNEEADARIFYLLGSSYRKSRKSAKAIKTFDEGLEKFPESGILLYERGNMELLYKNKTKALTFFEAGIKADPTFSSNYYRAAKLYCASTEEVWGMIYGEIFMNMERSSNRSVEISKLLFDTYKNKIQFSDDNQVTVSFCKNIALNESGLPFGIAVYESTLLLSLIGESKIDISSLDRVRTKFANAYHQNNYQEKYPNVLFDYQYKVLSAGHMEAYNHWVLMFGDPDGFEDWIEKNEAKWDAFIEWFTDNPLEITNENKFDRTQY